MASTAPKDPFRGAHGATAAVQSPYRWLTPSAFSDSEYLDAMGIAIRSAAAGTLYVRCADDVIHPMQFTAGETRAGRFTQLRSTGLSGITASDVEVAYVS